MNGRVIAFGEIEIEGRRYTHDVVIEAGEVRKRGKKPSKAYRGEYGHTPLSEDEALPWGGGRLVIGTGFSGSLPLTPGVRAEAERRGVAVVAVPTSEAFELLRGIRMKDVHAVLHVTC